MAALNRHVFLIGLPGTGKTTLGRALQALGYSFVDLDGLIEAETGTTIAVLVATYGMDSFRRLESDCLRRLVAGQPCIVGCGGGTPCHDGNMELMQSAGLTVRLTCSRERHLQRIVEAGASRPMFATVGNDRHAAEALLCDLEQQRAPFYNRATLTFDATRLETPAEVAATSRAFADMLGAQESVHQ